MPIDASYLRNLTEKAPSMIEEILEECKKAAFKGSYWIYFPTSHVTYMYGKSGRVEPQISKTGENLIKLLQERNLTVKPYYVTQPKYEVGFKISWNNN
jgi:hypothetical protein